MKLKNVILMGLCFVFCGILVYDENNRYEYLSENKKVLLSDNATVHYTTTPIFKNKEYYITY